VTERKNSAPEFTQDQRRRLRECGLIDAQIDEVETFALPICLALLTRPPTMQEVRNELIVVSKALERAHEAMAALSSANLAAPGRFEASQRVLMAEYNLQGDGSVFEKTLAQLVATQAVLNHAQAELPEGPRRDPAASAMPVNRIDQALLSGFVKWYSTEDAPMPHYMMKPSASPGSDFREIVGLCYEAMGRQNSDPERAIRAYVKWRKDRDRVQRAERADENGTGGTAKS